MLDDANRFALIASGFLLLKNVLTQVDISRSCAMILF